MASRLDKIKKKYGYTGDSYRELMSSIIGDNTQKIREKIFNNMSDDFNKKLKTDQRIIMPSLQDVIPTEEISIRKAADRGRLLTDTLRDKLSADMQSMFEILTPTTEEQRIIRRRGKLAGTMNPDMVRIFKEKINESFESYMKVDPKFGVPSNIHQIAVTELRSVTNEMKDIHIQKIIQNNPNIVITKKWIHNARLSKTPREPHVKLGRRAAIPYNENFVFIGQKGNTVSMKHPHDPDAPLEEVVGCNCEVEYRVKTVTRATVMKDLELGRLRLNHIRSKHMSINEDIQAVAKSLITKADKQEWISNKIGKLRREGKPEDQAAAIAYSMWEQEHSGE